MSIDATAPPERALGLAGSIIKGRYRVTGISSMTRDVVLYAAEEVRYGRAMTVMVLRDEVAADPQFVTAVREQAGTLAMSARAHRGVPRVYECGTTDGGDLFIALERLNGATLREALDERGAFDEGPALRIASEVGEALETLHHEGIVHGRLGPELVLLVTDNDGLEHARLVGVELTAAYRTPGGRHREPPSSAYVAPEQVDSGETTVLSDQYALGMLLREMLTAGSDDTSGALPPSLPPEIERIITTALEPRPWRRFPDISVMVNDIWAAHTALAEPMPRPRALERRMYARRRRRALRPEVGLRIGAAVAASGVVAVVVWLALSGTLGRSRASVTAPAVRGTSGAVTPRPATVPARATEAVTTPATPTPGREAPATLGEPQAHPSAAPRPAALGERPDRGPVPVVERGRAPVVDRSPSRPPEARPRLEQPRDAAPTDGGDGSAIIDWLVNRRR